MKNIPHLTIVKLDEMLSNMKYEDIEETIEQMRKACRYQVDALLLADWRFELPAIQDSEPWQWYWRRPPRRKNSLGKRYLSTQQAYNALIKEQTI